MPTTNEAPLPDPSTAPSSGLTVQEDDELRRLSFFNDVGELQGHKLERFLELRRRDQREAVRPPRDRIDEEDRTAALSAGWRLLAMRNR